MLSSATWVDVMVSPFGSVAEIGVCVLVACWIGPCTWIMCRRSKKWWVAPESSIMGGTWLCSARMRAARANFVWDDGDEHGGGCGVGRSLPLPVFHLRFG